MSELEEKGEELFLTPNEQEDLNSVDPQAESISYSGQDFDVDGLVRRLQSNDILIPTFGHDDEKIQAEGFQRAFVWRRPQMDKFIESILLGYPIPGVFLVKQTDKRYLVLDGQQRLLTLQFFTEGLYEGKEFALSNVADDFKGLTYKNLPDDLRRVFDNTFIQAIIVTSDGTTESLESIYKIFERLNSGGTQLTPHEIRVALFAGPFIGFLEELNNGGAWRELYGKKSPRLRDQELVLRVIGLYLSADTYKRPLKKFLNDVASEHRLETTDSHELLRARFLTATELIHAGIGKEAFRTGGSQVNAALAEVVMVGLMTRLTERGEDLSPESVAESVRRLKSDETVKEAIARSTADEAQVNARLTRALELFREI